MKLYIFQKSTKLMVKIKLEYFTKKYICGNISTSMQMWRNWYTHSTQNAAGNHVGSSPTICTNSKRL